VFGDRADDGDECPLSDAEINSDNLCLCLMITDCLCDNSSFNVFIVNFCFLLYFCCFCNDLFKDCIDDNDENTVNNKLSRIRSAFLNSTCDVTSNIDDECDEHIVNNAVADCFGL